MEELVAELGAAFLCTDLGVTPEPREDHAQYNRQLAEGDEGRQEGHLYRCEPCASRRRLSDRKATGQAIMACFPSELPNFLSYSPF